MDLKWIVLVVVILTVFVNHQVEAEIESRHEIWSARTKEYKNLIGTLSAWDEIFKRYYLEENKSDNKETETEFYFGHYYPKHEDVQDLGLECAPGRTFIKIEQPSSNQDLPDSSGEEDDFALRSHMNWKVNEEHCKICICSSDGEDMYCSKRPAMNVNECIRMSKLTEEFNSNGPYEHTRTLAHRIRRDYIWHKDEIPYEARAKCRRGTSYYSNSVTANDTDIDVASDVNSLLDYSNENICFYCICSITGRGVGCINRSPWFCEYFRQIRQKDGPRDMYTRLFEQDRPTYFRQLSWRLRRTMDNGIYDYTSAGGDTLCCSHPDGHRRNIHRSVRSKVRQMRKKVPKENLLEGGPGGDYADFIVNND